MMSSHYSRVLPPLLWNKEGGMNYDFIYDTVNRFGNYSNRCRYNYDYMRRRICCSVRRFNCMCIDHLVYYPSYQKDKGKVSP